MVRCFGFSLKTAQNFTACARAPCAPLLCSSTVLTGHPCPTPRRRTSSRGSEAPQGFYPFVALCLRVSLPTKHPTSSPPNLVPCNAALLMWGTVISRTGHPITQSAQSARDSLYEKPPQPGLIPNCVAINLYETVQVGPVDADEPTWLTPVLKFPEKSRGFQGFTLE